jgi:hypothetical protein
MHSHSHGFTRGVLQCNLSDDDDADDLSQHSFLVLSNMESVAADRSELAPPPSPDSISQRKLNGSCARSLSLLQHGDVN